MVFHFLDFFLDICDPHVSCCDRHWHTCVREGRCLWNWFPEIGLTNSELSAMPMARGILHRYPTCDLDLYFR